MKRLLLLLLTIPLWAPIHLSAQEVKNECLPIRDIPVASLSFKDGESLTFVASHTWGPRVGELSTKITLKEDTKEPYFHVEATIKTSSFFDAFFRIRDTYEAKIRARNLTPIYFYRDINEGKYTIKNRFNYLEGNVIDAQITRSGNRIKDTLMLGKPCTFDPMTLLYFARNIETSTMKELDFLFLSFVIDEEMHDLTFRYIGTELKKISGVGTFRAKKFAVSLVAGVVFTGKEEMLVWISDDDNHLPLSLESPVIVGKVTARISKFEGLKFPLTSKVK